MKHIHMKTSLYSRYRAVASWSRVQGNGIPLITAIEILSIWGLSFVLAIPEAIGFVMVPFDYRNETLRTCMFDARSPFMEVCICSCFMYNPLHMQSYACDKWLYSRSTSFSKGDAIRTHFA